MRMKKMKICLVVLIVLLACLVGGCGKDYGKMVENHAAIKTYRDGVWGIRYFFMSTNATTQGKTDSVTVQLTVDVNGDMTEEQMMEVMDYYESTRNAWFDEDGTYKGEQDAEYSCYAIFYRGDTDEEIRRIKYQNGKETEPTEEEESMFPLPGMRTDKVGENP